MTALRRLTLALLFAAALVVPPVAAAKDIQGSRVCGASGCADTGPLGMGGFALIPPGQDLPPLAPWYRIRLAMGDSDRVLQRYAVLWAPRIHMVAVDQRQPRWLPASNGAERVARRITLGVEPFPAATMPVTLPPPGIAEVVGPVTTSARDGGGFPWLAIPIAAVVVAGAGLAYRSRRTKARTASAPTMST